MSLRPSSLPVPPVCRAPARVRHAALGLALAGVAGLSSCASTGTTTAPAACTGWSTADYSSGRVIRRLRIYTDPATGDSAIEDTQMAPKSTPLLKTGTILREYDFGPGSKVQIVVGPPNLEIPLHPAPYRESFLILQGSVVMRLGDGTQRELGPGDLQTYEDTTARRGHGGRTGPCGYVALNIVP